MPEVCENCNSLLQIIAAKDDLYAQRMIEIKNLETSRDEWQTLADEGTAIIEAVRAKVKELDNFVEHPAS